MPERMQEKAETTSSSVRIDEPQSEPLATESQQKDQIKLQNGFHVFACLFLCGSYFDRSLQITGTLAAIGAGTTNPLMAIVFGRLVDAFTIRRDVSSTELQPVINRYALYFVYLFIARFGLGYVYELCLSISALHITRAVRQRYLRALVHQDIDYFDSHTPGAVVADASSNGDSVQDGLSEKLGQLIVASSTVVSAYIVAFTQNWRLTLVVTPSVFVVLVGTLTMAKFDVKNEAAILNVSRDVSGVVQEALASIRNVLAFGAQSRILSRHAKMLDRARQLGLKKTPIVAAQHSIMLFVVLCTYGLAFWYGVRLILRGELATPGPIVIILLCINFAINSLLLLRLALDTISKATAAAQTLLTVSIQKPKSTVGEKEGWAQPKKTLGDIEFRNVDFSYPSRPSVPVLRGVTLRLEKGKTTAVIGSSGSGKSTIVGLLQRWYEPTGGIIMNDLSNISDMDKDWMRNQIGLVQQDPILFNDTIYQNVLNGINKHRAPDVPASAYKELVERACRTANIHDFIESLPMGYQTAVGERAEHLSGGQKQRIVIARAIISDPELLVLDEATSALDPESEKLVQDALTRISEHRTTLVITHKLTALENVDKIIVLHHGQVVECGSPRALLHARGAYYDLLKARELAQGDLKDQQAEAASSDRSIAEQELNGTRDLHSSLVQYSEQRQKPRNIPLMACIWKVLRADRTFASLFTCGIFACLVGGGVYLVQAILFAQSITILDVSQHGLSADRTDFWALMYFVVAIGALVAFVAFSCIYNVLGVLVGRRYQSEYFASMLKQDVSYFDDEGHSSGALMANLSADCSHLQSLMSTTLGYILVSLVNLGGSAILALAVYWKLGLVCIFGSLPPFIVAGYLRMRLASRNHIENRKLSDESSRFVAETVGAIRTITSLGLETEICGRYAERLQGPIASSYRYLPKAMVLNALCESIPFLGMGLAFWYGGGLQADLVISEYQFFVIYSAIISSGTAAGRFFGLTTSIIRASAAANQIFKLQAQEPPINSSHGKQPFTADPESLIEFQNVHFHYPNAPQIPVLRGLNLQIRSRQTVAIVGASGSGKSTIISLLERFYDTTSGQILVGKEPLPSVDVSAYRSGLALVSQETMLYDGTIRENILLGALDSSPDDEETRLLRACQDANIHDFILSLPQGYDTQCGSRGLAFSGGQRQRIAIARALIRDPVILLLDEATSSLDMESERLVQEALKRAGKDRTIVMVAHRLATVRSADCIFVLEKGRVVEEGTHADLMQRRGQYFKMSQVQEVQ